MVLISAKAASEEERGTAAVFFLAVVLLVLLFLLAISAEKRQIPASAACIAVGAVAGAILWPTGGAESLSGLGLNTESIAHFNRDIFYYVLLPPVIFEAGFSLHKRPFFNNLGTILVFAVVGTLLTVVAVGQPLYEIGRAGWFRDAATGADVLDFRTPLDAYLFAGCISATDPVATLSIMGAMGVDERLYAIVFGESVLNDAVAIVLVNIIEELGNDGFTHPAHFLIGIGQFFLVSLGSLFASVSVSALSALLLKWLRRDLAHHASFEVGFIVLFGYASYGLAEALECSGILALFIAGVLESHYHIYSLSEPGRLATAIALKSIAHLFETVIFLYVGLEIFAGLRQGGPKEASSAAILLPCATNSTQEGGPECMPPVCANGTDYAAGGCVPGVPNSGSVAGFAALSVTLVVLSRIVIVPPLCLLVNKGWKRKKPIGWAMVTALVAAGLRGAIAFALAKGLRSLHRDSIVAATITTIIFTVFVIGGSTRTLLTRLGLVLSPEENARERIKARDDQAREEAEFERDRKGARDAAKSIATGSSPLMDGQGAASSSNAARAGGWRRVLRRARRQLKNLDARVLRPLFIASDDSDGPQSTSPSSAQGTHATTAGPVLSASSGYSSVELPVIDRALRTVDDTRLPRGRPGGSNPFFPDGLPHPAPASGATAREEGGAQSA
jgi:sodium/hydrogen exchanger 8